MDELTLEFTGYIIKGVASVLLFDDTTANVDMNEQFIFEEEYDEDDIPLNTGKIHAKEIDSATISIYKAYAARIGTLIATTEIFYKEINV